jgi:ketosteroid isomerase-like protein
MQQASLPADLPASLDAVHERIRDAFQSRDLAAYLTCLAPDLAYREAGGRLVTREGLAASVARQFERLVTFHSDFDRAGLVAAGEEAIETGTQTASIALRWFGFLAIRWTVRRSGKYTWRRAADGWRLRAVELSEEKVRREGIHLAHRLRQDAV